MISDQSEQFSLRSLETAKNGGHLLQVVNFIGLLRLVNKLQQTCQFHQLQQVC